MGLHRGDVHTVTHLKKSTNGKDVPIRRFLFEPHREGKHPTRSRYVTRVRYNLWRFVYNAVQDNEVDGIVRNTKVELWKSLDNLLKLYDKKKWTNSDHR